MSLSRIKYIKQNFPISSYTYANGKITVTSSGNHNLFTGLPVTLISDINYYAVNGTANVTSANTFSINYTKHVQDLTHYGYNGYISTGAKDAQTLPRATGTETIVQSYVTGTGGAAYNIDVSLDAQHWIVAANATHTSTSDDTVFLTISPGWAYYRANVTAIGANTNLVFISGE